MKILRIIIACLFLGTSTAFASGVPTIDIANLTQNLINYLDMIQQTRQQIDQTLNQIEQLKRLEVPGLAEINRLKNEIENYKNLANRYNDLVGKYNTLSKLWDELDLIEKQKTCGANQTCSKSDMLAMNTKKIEIIKQINYQLQTDRKKYYNDNGEESEFTSDIKSDFESAKRIMDSVPLAGATEGQIQAAQIQMNYFLANQIIKLRKEIGDARGKDLQLKTLETQLRNSGQRSHIGSNYNKTEANE